MQKMITNKTPYYVFSILVVLCLILVVDACYHPTDNKHSTGTMSVVMNGVYHDLAKVRGGAYFGYFCGGDISGKSFSLALGLNPKKGDTLYLTSSNQTSLYSTYALYDGQYASPDSGMIFITSREGESINGSFQCNVYIATDTFKFRSGYFAVDFVPSD